MQNVISVQLSPFNHREESLLIGGGVSGLLGGGKMTERVESFQRRWSKSNGVRRRHNPLVGQVGAVSSILCTQSSAAHVRVVSQKERGSAGNSREQKKNCPLCITKERREKKYIYTIRDPIQ